MELMRSLGRLIYIAGPSPGIPLAKLVLRSYRKKFFYLSGDFFTQFGVIFYYYSRG